MTHRVALISVSPGARLNAWLLSDEESLVVQYFTEQRCWNYHCINCISCMACIISIIEAKVYDATWNVINELCGHSKSIYRAFSYKVLYEVLLCTPRRVVATSSGLSAIACQSPRVSSGLSFVSQFVCFRLPLRLSPSTILRPRQLAPKAWPLNNYERSHD